MANYNSTVSVVYRYNLLHLCPTPSSLPLQQKSSQFQQLQHQSSHYLHQNLDVQQSGQQSVANSQGDNSYSTRFTSINLPLPKFDGNDDVRSWIYKCERIFSLENTFEHMKVSQASFALEGRAWIWHQVWERKHSLKGLCSWDVFVKAIVDRFGLIFEVDGNTAKVECQNEVVKENEVCSGPKWENVEDRLKEIEKSLNFGESMRENGVQVIHGNEIDTKEHHLLPSSEMELCINEECSDNPLLGISAIDSFPMSFSITSNWDQVEKRVDSTSEYLMCGCDIKGTSRLKFEAILYEGILAVPNLRKNQITSSRLLQGETYKVILALSVYYKAWCQKVHKVFEKDEVSKEAIDYVEEVENSDVQAFLQHDLQKNNHFNELKASLEDIKEKISDGAVVNYHVSDNLASLGNTMDEMKVLEEVEANDDDDNFLVNYHVSDNLASLGNTMDEMKVLEEVEANDDEDNFLENSLVSCQDCANLNDVPKVSPNSWVNVSEEIIPSGHASIVKFDECQEVVVWKNSFFYKQDQVADINSSQAVASSLYQIGVHSSSWMSLPAIIDDGPLKFQGNFVISDEDLKENGEATLDYKNDHANEMEMNLQDNTSPMLAFSNNGINIAQVQVNGGEMEKDSVMEVQVDIFQVSSQDKDIILLNQEQIHWFHDTLNSCSGEEDVLFFEYKGFTTEEIVARLIKKGLKPTDLSGANNQALWVISLQKLFNIDPSYGEWKQFSGKVEIMSRLLHVNLHIFMRASYSAFGINGNEGNDIFSDIQAKAFINTLNCEMQLKDVFSFSFTGAQMEFMSQMEFPKLFHSCDSWFYSKEHFIKSDWSYNSKMNEGNFEGKEALRTLIQPINQRREMDKSDTYDKFVKAMSVDFQGGIHGDIIFVIGRLTNSDDEEFSPPEFKVVDGQHFEVMHKILEKIIFIVWNWYYKQSGNILEKFSEDFKIKTTQCPQYGEHPGRGNLEWKIAWIFEIGNASWSLGLEGIVKLGTHY